MRKMRRAVRVRHRKRTGGRVRRRRRRRRRGGGVGRLEDDLLQGASEVRVQSPLGLVVGLHGNALHHPSHKVFVQRNRVHPRCLNQHNY